MQIKSNLKFLMEKEGIDQKTLASELNLSPTTVGKIYRNQFTRIDIETMIKLCEKFNCQSLSELIELSRD